MSNNLSHITIRETTSADTGELVRLAQLDSASVPAQPVLVAFAGGEMQAAVSTVDGAAIAHPFRPTQDLVRILRIEAGVERNPAKGIRAYRRLWPRNPRSASPRPSAPSVPGFPVIPGHTL
jgi:hypothetical protein